MLELRSHIRNEKIGENYISLSASHVDQVERSDFFFFMISHVIYLYVSHFFVFRVRAKLIALRGGPGACSCIRKRLLERKRDAIIERV